MKILHTSDWHLGGYLEGYSRLDEQILFVDELTQIVEKHEVDLILLSGDVFDTANPPSGAQKLFYDSIQKLSQGKRVVVTIAGNHDSPERLCAPEALMYENGCVVLGLPSSAAKTGDYGFYQIIDAGEGYMELVIGQQSAIILTMPFPSEKRLNELMLSETQRETQLKFSDKIGEIFHRLEDYYRKDTVNLAMGHFHIVGGLPSKSERDIQYGGSYAVHASALPKKADYIAMGHLHRTQKIPTIDNGFYSGSPIQYSYSEAEYHKNIIIVEVSPGEKPLIEKIPLTVYKPIEAWNATSIEDALSLWEQNKDRDCYVYLNIQSKRPLQNSERKLLFSGLIHIVEISLSLEGEENHFFRYEEEKTVMEEFIDFYQELYKNSPEEELIQLFLEIASDNESFDGGKL